MNRIQFVNVDTQRHKNPHLETLTQEEAKKRAKFVMCRDFDDVTKEALSAPGAPKWHEGNCCHCKKKLIVADSSPAEIPTVCHDCLPIVAANRQ